ncbi:RyR domain-containing protein [Pseudoduganella sp. SL102]|uniref:RyR domain-containing protein n=1 Tax=Pseudoduganella sp. SL102 TaxID=2995154 RepID=UPI00248ADA12|nr:RyR domain-containing protein [Pseudoduganella sp. SL102]WBS00236.1 RyR domain-containing protein [Pseudoduganella sp. SL102]
MSTTHITPTVGRIVWFYPASNAESSGFSPAEEGQPLAAIITRVVDEAISGVHLAVFDANGVSHPTPYVQLLQEGEEAPPSGRYATWMPYQVGQAKKHAATPVGVADELQGARARIDRIARVAHEVNRAYCQALGDSSQPAWEDAPEWQRVSARMGVDLHLSGDFGPEASHIAWMRQKIDEGWTYGPEKNPELKQHHCLVPFDQLPREQQAKDYLFRGVVHALRG